MYFIILDEKYKYFSDYFTKSTKYGSFSKLNVHYMNVLQALLIKPGRRKETALSQGLESEERKKNQ